MKTLRTRRGTCLRLVLAPSFALLAMFGLGLSTSVSARAQSAALAMRAVGAPSSAVDMGALPSGTPVQVTLHMAVPAQRAVGLESFLADVVDPSSAAYHHWLTPAEFGARFGADAATVAAVVNFTSLKGLRLVAVSASGLRLTVAGTAAQMEDAFAPALHGFQTAAGARVGNTAVPRVPMSLAAALRTVDGFNTVEPAVYGLAVDGRGAAAGGWLAALADAVDANQGRVLALQAIAGCGSALPAGEGAALSGLLAQASAQGLTTVVEAQCETGYGASFVAAAGDAAVFALTPGLAAAVDATQSGPRPAWQFAAGLPLDTQRHAPDATVGSLAALTATLEGVIAAMPASADGTPARLGNIAPTLYAMAPMTGLYSQPDSAAGGTWEPLTGLGVIDLQALANFLPRGTLSDNVSVNASNYSPNHGQFFTLTCAVSDTSGQGKGVSPTGAVTFTTSTGLTLGSGTLTNGSFSATLNTLPGGTYSVTANYAGDATYAPNHSVAANVSVQGEEVALSAAIASSVPVGGSITVNVTAKSVSGVGTPSGTVTVKPQGTTASGTYTGTLNGANGTSTTTVSVPATQAGNVVLLVQCVSNDPSFTCFTSTQVSAVVTQAPSTTTLTVAPNPPVAGQTTTFTATVKGAALPAVQPTGNVNFSDGSTILGSGTLQNGTATFTSQSLSGTVTHNFTATYGGDNNYTSSTATGTTTTPTLGPTTTALSVSPNPPVAGATTTLTATITYTSIGTFPTGLVTFFEDGAQIGTGSVGSNGIAQFMSTTISSTSSHTFYATYAGDTNYATSVSPTVATAANGAGTATTTTLTINPNPPVTGSSTTLTAVIAYGATGTGPTGTVQFYQDGGLLGQGTVAGGVASFSTSGIVGTAAHSFYAKYLGDASYAGSQSATVATSPTTATGTTNTTIAASSSMQVTGASTTFTATVIATTVVGNVQPTGTVTFTSSLQGVLQTVPLGANNQAMLTTSLVTQGAQSITATYNGDTKYAASSSTSPAVVTVGPAVPATQSLVIAPLSTVPYGTLVTATYSLSGITTTGAGTPAGTVAFSVPLATGIAPSTVALTATSATTAMATFSFTAPAPGTYTVQATCTGTNFTCPTAAAMATLVVAKGNTSTTVSALPAAPVAGQQTTLTATIAALAPSTNPTNAFTGMVTFYDNGVSLGTGTVTGNTATFATTFNTTTPHSITAQYSGDTNWNMSTSAALSLVAPPATTTTTLTASTNNALQGSLIVFTVTVGVAPTTPTPTPGVPVGSVTLYDTYNGQTTALGTMPLTASGPYSAIAQLSTTGLFQGTHSISALYAATTAFSGSTSNALTVNITDYAVTFTPATLNLSRGATGTSIAIVTALNGFAGTVVLGCTPPSDTATTCSFSPSVLTGSGTSILTVTTTAAHAFGSTPPRPGARMLGVTMAAGLLCLLLPRRRRLTTMLCAVMMLGLVAATGCGTYLDNAGANTSNVSGTPQGTLLFNVVTSGSDGRTTNRHNSQFQVVVQ